MSVVSRLFLEGHETDQTTPAARMPSAAAEVEYQRDYYTHRTF